jgi:aspartokinase-like uncharacterized kinase
MTRRESTAHLAVFKVGGSLLEWPLLPARLAQLIREAKNRGWADRVVLIAGGGPTVDVIRALDRVHSLSDQAAHQLALHGLDLTASILSAILPGSAVVDRVETLSEAWAVPSIPILAPRRVFDEIEHDDANPLPQSWLVTSDTIAARIAAHIHAQRLVLLKSAPLLAATTLDEAARLGLVDPMFPAIARSLVRVDYVDLRGGSREHQRLVP